MENCENEDDFEWKPVRRLAHWDRRNNMGLIKECTKQRQERRLSVSKHIIVEDDDLSDDAESDGQSGMETASMLCSMLHVKLLEVVKHCPSEYAAAVHAERSCIYHACSCSNSSGFLWVARPVSTAGTRPKRHAVLKFRFGQSHWSQVSKE